MNGMEISAGLKVEPVTPQLLKITANSNISSPSFKVYNGLYVTLAFGFEAEIYVRKSDRNNKDNPFNGIELPASIPLGKPLFMDNVSQNISQQWKDLISLPDFRVKQNNVWSNNFSFNSEVGHNVNSNRVWATNYNFNSSIHNNSMNNKNIIWHQDQKAEDATIAKSTFLANMSHEIRTPLNAIIGITYILQQTDLNTKQNNYLKTIELSSKNLLSIINDILDFSKIEAGKLQIESVDFNFQDVLDNLSSILMIKARAKQDLEIIFNIDPKIPQMLKGDPLRFGQVLINLTNNAVKFTETGEIILNIKLLKNQDNLITLETTVKDTGIGLTEEQQAKLFQKFTQADASTVRKYGGTGLGLTVSKELVELMGGKIWVTSKKNKGSTFCFTIQFEKSDVAVLTKEEKSMIDLTGMKVLIVDDNQEMRDALKNMLDSLSFEVTTVSSGEAAVNLLNKTQKDNPFRLAIVDWKMPFGMDGIETINKINHTLSYNAPKFIFLTAYDKDELVVETNSLKIDAFMNKPVSPSMLYDTIIDCFTEKQKESEISDHEKKIIEDEYHSLKDSNLLLVEDNEINREIATEILNQLSINVFTAVNGQEAVDLICNKENNFDIVLMDVQMPVMDGLTASKIIREKGITKLPIIAMTAHAMKEDKIKSYSAGMNDHITKPVIPEALFKTIKKWISAESIKKRHNYENPKGLDIKNNSFINLKGINTSIGLTMIGNNEDLYKKLLLKFYDECKNILSEIKEKFPAKDTEQCCKILHSLKGNSGNLGASEIQKISAEFEKALKEEKNADKHFENLKAALETIIDSLGTLKLEELKKESVGDGEELGTEMELKKLIAEISPFLELQNIKNSKKIISKIKQYKWSKQYEKNIDLMYDHISKFNFDEAKNIANDISITLTRNSTR